MSSITTNLQVLFRFAPHNVTSATILVHATSATPLSPRVGKGALPESDRFARFSPFRDADSIMLTAKPGAAGLLRDKLEEQERRRRTSN